MPASPSERSLSASIAAHSSWAKTSDRSARTAPARRAALDRFERQVDPDGTLDPAERAIRAEHARKAHFQRMALKSAQVRRANKGRADLERMADELEAEALRIKADLAQKGGAGDAT